jgi:hypothetical protein
LLLILILIQIHAGKEDQEQDQEQEQESAEKTTFFRAVLKLANAKPFPAFFASLCPRVGQRVEREADDCFLPSPFWPSQAAIHGWRAMIARPKTTGRASK